MSSDVDQHQLLSDIGVDPADVPKVRRAAARNAADAAELTEFLHMLGVYPDQEHPVVVRRTRGASAR